MKNCKDKQIIEKMDGMFANVQERNIDSDNHTISNVCLFGRRESLNGRTYSDQAIDSIVTLSEGGKCFINHITKQEMKDRSGVRDLRDFVGVFSGSRRDGEKVLSNLKVREAYWDLVKDIAVMQPAGVGHSIDARIKVFQDDKGKENVADVTVLRSTDLVASAATTDNLFEAAILENKSESGSENYIKQSAKDEVKRKLASLNIKEGLLKDQSIKRDINKLTYDAEDLIASIMHSTDKTIPEKKKAITGILNDLETEVKLLLGQLGTKESKQLDTDEALVVFCDSTGIQSKCNTDATERFLEKLGAPTKKTEQSLETFCKEAGIKTKPKQKKETKEQAANKFFRSFKQ